MKSPDMMIEKVEPGSALAVLAVALDQVEPGSFVCYHKGLAGSAPTSMKRAAYTMHERGRCLLTQRIVGHNEDGERIVEYLAIRAKG